MPIPVSRTEKRSRAAEDVVSATWILRLTVPRSVNLIALPTRLRSTCLNRTGSPCSQGGKLGDRLMLTLICFSMARCRRSAIASLAAAPGEKQMDSNSSLPLSIFEKSKCR